MTQLTRERIDAEGWIGDHRADVLELLERAELAERQCMQSFRNGGRIVAIVAAEEVLDQDSWPACIQRLQGTAFDEAAADMRVIAENVRALEPDPAPDDPQPAPELVSAALVERAVEVLDDTTLTTSDAVARASTLLREALGR